MNPQLRRAAIKSIACFIPGQPLTNRTHVARFMEHATKTTQIPHQYLEHMQATMSLPGHIVKNTAWTSQSWFKEMREILPPNKKHKADSMVDGIQQRRIFPISPYGIEGMQVYLGPPGKSLCETVEPLRMLPSDAEALAGALCLHNATPQHATEWPKVDLVLSFAMTPEKTMPSTACLVHEKLGIRNGSAFHMDACCATQAYQHAVAAAMVQSGMARNVLCTASFCYWALRDQTDYFSAILGDAASAILVGESDSGGLVGTASRAYGRTNNTTWEEYGIADLDKYYNRGGIQKRRIRLNTDSTYQSHFIKDMKSAVAEIVPKALTSAKTTLREIDFVVTHQAVKWSGGQVVKDIGFTGEYFNTFSQVGNVAACSPTINAWTALKTTMPNRMKKMMWVCTGAGSSGIANVEVVSEELRSAMERDFVVPLERT